MTDERPLRGPDFLPYTLPATPQASYLPPPPSSPPRKGRWERALDGVPFLGVVSIAAGCAALILLAIVSWVAGREGPGAVVVSIAAVTSLVTGWLAVRADVPKDSRTLVQLGQSIGVVSAVAALVVYAGAQHDDGTQAVSPPSPQATAPVSPTPDPSTAPTQPTPGPSVTTSPGAVNGFGTPSTPDQPLTQAATDFGTLYGHVVDTSGKPIKGAVITITRAAAGDISDTPDCPTRITTQTDAQGVYRQQLCQLGDQLGYSVTITVPGAKAHHDLFINSGQTTVYDVILPLRNG